MKVSTGHHPFRGLAFATKASLLLASLLAVVVPNEVSAAFDENAVQLDLPTVIGDMVEVSDVDNFFEEGQAPVLLPPSNADMLVTLNRVTKGKYVPVGRSYNGNDWERVAGANDKLDYTCEVDETISSDKLCQVNLPIYENTTYYLTSYNHTISDKNKVARFLEKSTFGVTPADLKAWDYNDTDASIGKWVEEQMTTAGMSSHRAYFRKRLNPRSTETYRYSVAGKKACEKFSRWRRFAFTLKDLYMSQHHLGFDMEVSTVESDGATGYLLSIAGSVRTVLTAPLQYYGTMSGLNDYLRNQGSNDVAGTLDMSGSTSYQICALEEIEGVQRPDSDLPRTFAVEVNGKCTYIVGGNPTVNLDERFIDMNSVHQLDMRSLDTTTDLVVINDRITKGSDLLLTREINDANCVTFPDPTDNDFRGPDDRVPFATDFFINYTSSKFNPDAPVFGQLPDGGYALLDYRLDFDENTMKNPLMDGGANKVIAAAHGGDEQVYYCANVPQNIFNEDSCKLSNEENVCSSFDEKIALGIYLNYTNLVSLADITDRSVYAVSNLRFDETNLPDTATNPDAVVDLPCDNRKRSRWVRVDKMECFSPSVPINATTAAEFARSLAVSWDENPHLRDIAFGSKCHPNDVKKYGMAVYVMQEDTCFRNVHPDHLSIYDVTSWLGSNIVSTDDESGFLTYPESFDMQKWEIEHTDTVNFGSYIGRYGDKIRYEDLPTELQASTLTLDELAILSLQDMTARYVYAVDNLRGAISRLPCSSGMRSRWVPVDSSECSSPSVPVDAATTSAFAQAFQLSSDENTYLRDVEFGGTCHVDDTNKTGMAVDVNGQCYLNVHPDHMSVYDITGWVTMNNETFSDGNITLDMNDTATLQYPDVFSMERWESEVKDKRMFTFIGRYGDEMEMTSLPEHLRSTGDTFLDASYKLEDTIDNHQGGTIVCGSPGEVAPDPYMDDHFDITNLHLDSSPYHNQIKQTVWTMLALNADDQIRQRVAWALSQIFVISPYGITGPYLTEPYVHYYDIFVRNAFKNYRDIFREVAFHPKMGMYLSSAGSTSVGYKWDAVRQLQHPDENFARECFQLFSIGLVKLNMDGTPKLDDSGTPVKTYDTKDIVSFARAWTGLWYGTRRSNYEESTWIHNNFMDPMVIKGRKHDFFPKRALDGKFIGDRYPLCYDLPDRPFLRKGAKYRLLGGSSQPKWQEDDSEWSGDESVKRVELSQSSELYAKLCNSNGSTCQYSATVTLDTNLACDGTECNIDTIRVVQVEPGVFFEFLRQPCVQHAFYEGGKRVFGGWNNYITMCAHPKMPVATEVCCTSESELDDAHRPCEYQGERISFASNEQRCIDNGWVACNPNSVELPNFNDDVIECKDFTGVSLGYPDMNVYHWTNEPCVLRMFVKQNGLVAIIHDPLKTKKKYWTDVDPYTTAHVNHQNTMNYFSIQWEKNSTGDDQFPSMENYCGFGACSVTRDQYNDKVCFCDTIVTETPVFSEMPTRDQVLSELTIGAFTPDTFDVGAYEVVGTGNDGVEAYRPTGASDFTVDTIFKVLSEHRETIYLKNMKSTVQVGTSDKYTIRNPPHFMDIVDPEVRDAYYEIEAVLDQYLYHDNTAPFFSKLLIQRFGISNPSPRYIETVANAFQAGSFEWTSGSQNATFGDGKWGNLGATVAAILLDREATSVVLDADPAHGSIREPLLKVIGFMKAMEYTRTPHDRLVYPMLDTFVASARIGQNVYESPSVFSFFSPDHAPSGQFSLASLVSPESDALSMPTVVGISNGLFNMIRHGLNGCGYGLGPSPWGCRLRSSPDTWLPAGNYENSVGYLAFSPESNHTSGEDVIDELATLITSGRLSDENREIILSAYNSIYNTTNSTNTTEEETAATALRIAQQLIITTPEFHATSLVRKTGNARQPSTSQIQSNGESYKAIVYVMLFGGMDSLYMLSPHHECDLYLEYAEARTDLATLAPEDMLSIDAVNSLADQPCETFGVNKKLSIVKDLYDSGVGAFFVNTGHLSKPVSKFNYFTETKTQLFSHYSMEQEAYAVDPFKEKTGTGVLGRMLDVLEDNNYFVGSMGIGRHGACLQGDAERGRAVDVVQQGGVHWFYGELHKVAEDVEPDTMKTYFNALNGETAPNSGLFGNHWSKEFIDGIEKSDALGIINMNAGLTETGWSPEGAHLAPQLETVSKLIKTHEMRGTNRDVFYVKVQGYDTHSHMRDILDNLKFPDLNFGIEKFYKEMQHQGKLDAITFVLASEFGRTISPNSGGGTDHAWGGNYFVFGGEINGGAIYGQYPESFKENDLTNDGRGRLIPTTSWDSMWNAISHWFGITSEEDLMYVLPNRNNFGCRLITDTDLYKNGQTTNVGCSGDKLIFQQSLLLAEARYLTGEEQKAFCDALVSYISRVTTSPVKCVIVGQNIEMVSGRRGLSGGFSVAFDSEITSDDVGYGSNALQVLTDSAEEMATSLADSGAISGLTGVVTNSFTTPSPTAPPTPAPTPHPTGLGETYSQWFYKDVTATAGQCDAWGTFLNSLTATYGKVTVSGSRDTTGRSCDEPVKVQQLAHALKSKVDVGVITCGGYNWRVGVGCGAGCGHAVELIVGDTVGTCSCSSTDYILRPSIGNSNWGGINGPTCSAETQTMTVEFSDEQPPEPVVTGLSLVDTSTNQIIKDQINDGDTISLSTYGTSIGIIARTEGEIGSVRFWIDGDKVKTENKGPYHIAGDRRGNYNAWDYNTGTQTIKVTPYTESRAKGTAGTSVQVTVTITPEFVISVKTGSIDTQQSGMCADFELHPLLEGPTQTVKLCDLPGLGSEKSYSSFEIGSHFVGGIENIILKPGSNDGWFVERIVTRIDYAVQDWELGNGIWIDLDLDTMKVYTDSAPEAQ